MQEISINGAPRNNRVDIYKQGLRPLLFAGLKADPEWLHLRLIETLSGIATADATRNPPLTPWLRQQCRRAFCSDHPSLSQTLWGLTFPNPVGLAAGFDKDGRVAHLWQDFGFGFAELGTVTLHAQPGNPRPRLFRLPQDQAALNRMGFNNQGAAAMAERLGERGDEGGGMKDGWGWGDRPVNPSLSMTHHPNSSLRLHPCCFPIGINLGKSKITPLELAAEDYVGSFRLLKGCGDYFVVNVSSPNTPGLRSLQDADQLDRILGALQQENREQRPLLVKIAPDLEDGAIADILILCQTHRLAGIIATNTTIRRDRLHTQRLAATGNPISQEAGGISGTPVRQRSTEVIRLIHQKTNGTLPIIGVGGIFTAEDAWEKITAGASLVQIYTGWFYEGPAMVRRILDGLAQKLETQGLSHLSQAIGLKGN
ncbi:MAG: quinone-dependent dihydroorotate dehydrogenase [Cyanobacteria bacterium J069]|nr:MAG: quinone-dependent dihydroorotate dehydrogenase [Cyanobacteria bacterium J069]